MAVGKTDATTRNTTVLSDTALVPKAAQTVAAPAAAPAPKQWVSTGPAPTKAVTAPTRDASTQVDEAPPFAQGANGGLSPFKPFAEFLSLPNPTERTLKTFDSTLRAYFKTGQFGEFQGQGGKTIRYAVFAPPRARHDGQPRPGLF